MIDIKHVQKIGYNKQAYGFLIKHAGDHIEKRLLEWAIDHESPGIAAFYESICIGGLVYSIDEDNKSILIEFMVIEPDFRKGGQVFILLLSTLRKIFCENKIETLLFGHHSKNKYMAERICRLAFLEKTYIRYRADASSFL